MSEYYAGLVQGRAMLQLATIYKSAVAALAQAVENSRDAHATHIWVVLETNRISVIDNGDGMIPTVLPEDAPYFTMMEEVQAQNLDLSLEEIRKLISEPSRKSVEWMMKYGSFSPKNPEEGTLGEKGIGHLAYLTYGESATLTTLPHISLARSYFGTNVKQNEIAPYSVELHSRESLARNDTRYSVLSEFPPLTDPWGEKLLHGTRIQVTNLNEGIERELAPGLLASYLKDKFGPDIREGRLTIQVIDKMTKEGRTIPNGKVIIVEPVKYTGQLVINEQMRTNALTGNIPFNVVIYFDREGKYKTGIELRKRGAPAGNLTDLVELNQAPWNSGLFGGYAEFPTYPHEERLWTPSKDTLLPSQERRHFVNKLLLLEPRLKQFIEEQRVAQRQQRREALAERVEEAAALAIQEVESVQHLAISSKRRTSKKSETNKTSRDATLQQEPATVVVKVLNEHNRGVPDIEIQLMQNRRLVTKGKTGMSGTISLGTIPLHDRDKNHFLLITVPYGTRLLELSEPQYRFKPNQLGGFKWIFRLKTGDKPRERQVPRVKFVFTDKFADPEEPWQQKLSVGLIEVNQNTPAYLEAEVAGIDDMLLADYAAAAIVEYGLPNMPTPYCMKQQTLLFGVMLNHAREVSGARAKRTRRK